jgi:hypothetical protein
VALQNLEIIFILLAWIFGILSWYFGYQAYAAARAKAGFYIYFFFGGLSVGMILVLRIFGLMRFYDVETWLVAYDFFLMVSAILMMFGFREMFRSLGETT